MKIINFKHTFLVFFLFLLNQFGIFARIVFNRKLPNVDQDGEQHDENKFIKISDIFAR